MGVHEERARIFTAEEEESHVVSYRDHILQNQRFLGRYGRHVVESVRDEAHRLRQEETIAVTRLAQKVVKMLFKVVSRRMREKDLDAVVSRTNRLTKQTLVSPNVISTIMFSLSGS